MHADGVRKNLTHENLTIRKVNIEKVAPIKKPSNKFSHVRISHTYKYLACFQPPRGVAGPKKLGGNYFKK